MLWGIVATLVLPAVVFVVLIAKHQKDNLRKIEPVSRHWLADQIKGDWSK